jgi:hypothetical protein
MQSKQVWVLGGCREKEGFLSLLFSSLIACTGMSEVVTFRFFGRFLWLWNVWSGVNMGALPGLSSSAWGHFRQPLFLHPWIYDKFKILIPK